jgi:SulP family sulfate permease
MAERSHVGGEIWGGVSAMLVALPSAIAFGVTIFAPLGGTYAARGAVAGILGATALGLVAPALGGTNRLITAPCAPAAAVLSAIAIGFTQRGTPPETTMLLLGIVVLLTGLLQIGFGVVGLGRLIKYMPYPVVSGYLSGVGLLIILSQFPKLLGAPKSAHMWEALTHPGEWQWHAMVVGGVTMLVMLLAPRVTKAVPATILGLLAGVATYFAIAMGDQSLLSLAGNAAVVGPLGVGGPGALAGITERFSAVRAFDVAQLPSLIVPALSLAVLLSIDTLKTCVVIDALTRSRHNSNRELIAQGCANLAATAIGGVPGAGTMGATLVNISSGARTRLSGTVEGVAALLAFVALGSVLAWIPLAALAGILIVVGVRMFDRHSLQLLRSRATALDFFVIVAVVLVAETVSLIAASGVGVALAIMLFIREQAHTSVVWRRMLGSQIFSKQVRLPREVAVLERQGVHTAVLELQGSLFFGTTDQLYTALEPDLASRRFVILDLGRVQSVDVTAIHMLEQLEDILRENGGELLFSRVPHALPNGTNVEHLLEQSGLLREGRARIFGELDGALEWAEDQTLAREHVTRDEETPLDFRELALFSGRKPDTFVALEACAEQRHYKANDRVFAAGDTGHELFLIRRGTVRIELPVGDSHRHHLATFGRGDFFGEMAFLDQQPRSADAVAERETDIYVIQRSAFDGLSEQHRHAALNLVEGLARTLAMRLRQTNIEVRALEDG